MAVIRLFRLMPILLTVVLMALSAPCFAQSQSTAAIEPSWLASIERILDQFGSVLKFTVGIFGLAASIYAIRRGRLEIRKLTREIEVVAVYEKSHPSVQPSD